MITQKIYRKELKERKSEGEEELGTQRAKKGGATVKWTQNKKERRGKGQHRSDMSVIISSHSQHGIHNGKINLSDSCVIGFAGSRAESVPSGQRKAC